MVERKSAGRRRDGARCAWIALPAAWLLLGAAPAPAREDVRPAERLWDAYPLRAAPDKAAAPTRPAAMEATTAGSDDHEWTAVALSLALLAGGATGWLLSTRPPSVRVAPRPATATATAAPARSVAPRLWAASADAPAFAPPPPRPAPTAAPSPPPSPRAPAPPEPDRAWAAEIGWHLVDDASQFRATARPVEGGDKPITLGASSLLAWPPAGARSVQALTDAVKALESTLVAAGWTPLPRGIAWYAKRFTWQPGARPPAAPAAPGRARHRGLYEAEYASQVDRTLRLRRTIAARVLPNDAVEAAPK